MDGEGTLGQAIKGLEPGQFLRLRKVLPSGSLEARRLASGGVALYWRSTIGGKTDRAAIGLYDAGAPPKSLKPTRVGYSINAATRAAEALAQKHQDNKADGGYPALVAREKEAARVAAVVKVAAQAHKLSNLMAHYCDHLQYLERSAHKDARSIFRIHVSQAWPDVAATQANQVTGEQVADMMRKTLEAGKARTANKLRSYLRAAYQTALAARSKASIPLHFKAYDITANPAADTVPDEGANRADKHPLSTDELRTYWRAIKDMDAFRGAVLRLHLLSGGQRIEQLVNLRAADVTGTSITLHDGKGRPGKPPRPHVVPLVPMAAAALLGCRPAGIYALSTDGGNTHLAATTLSGWSAEAGAAIPDFQAKRIRSGVETLLASLGVSAEIRGRLQSHGISGVQARHYDGHDYLVEKRTALVSLFNALERKAGDKVVAIDATKRRAKS